MGYRMTAAQTFLPSSHYKLSLHNTMLQQASWALHGPGFRGSSLLLGYITCDARSAARMRLVCAWRRRRDGHRQAVDLGLQRALGCLGCRQPAPRLRQLRDMALAVRPAQQPLPLTQAVLLNLRKEQAFHTRAAKKTNDCWSDNMPLNSSRTHLTTEQRFWTPE